MHKYTFKCPNVFVSAQIYFSLPKCIVQCTNKFPVHKYVFQCTNIFFSAQMYFSVHKYVFQCINAFFRAEICFSAQIYFSVHKYIFRKQMFFSAPICFSAEISFAAHKYISRAQIYFLVHKYKFQCANNFPSAQIRFSVSKIIPGTQWPKNGQKTQGIYRRDCH